ncbi:hypothetical protein PENTCL1PPCAC_26011, partial [Pristionchus entomophagus]
IFLAASTSSRVLTAEAEVYSSRVRLVDGGERRDGSEGMMNAVRETLHNAAPAAPAAGGVADSGDESSRPPSIYYYSQSEDDETRLAEMEEDEEAGGGGGEMRGSQIRSLAPSVLFAPSSSSSRNQVGEGAGGGEEWTGGVDNAAFEERRSRYERELDSEERQCLSEKTHSIVGLCTTPSLPAHLISASIDEQITYSEPDRNPMD